MKPVPKPVLPTPAPIRPIHRPIPGNNYTAAKVFKIAGHNFFPQESREREYYNCQNQDIVNRRDSGSDFDHFLFPFLEVKSQITELSCNYPTRKKNQDGSPKPRLTILIMTK